MSEYAYERTLMMEQRSEIFRRLGAAAANRKQSLLLEQEVDGRVIRFRIRKQSTSDFEDLDPGADSGGAQYPMVELNTHHINSSALQSPVAGSQRDDNNNAHNAVNTPAHNGAAAAGAGASVRQPDETNVRRMQTALSLNEAILRRSKAAKLVILNLPGAPKLSTPEAENNCKYICSCCRRLVAAAAEISE